MTDTFPINQEHFTPGKVLIDDAVGHLMRVAHPAKEFESLFGHNYNDLETALKAVFEHSTDKPLTVLNYRPCKLYDGSSKKVSKPDLSKQWFVYYSYRDPSTGKMERHRIFRNINEFSTIGERKLWASFWIRMYNTLLKAGYSPYEKHVNQKTGDINPNIISCMDMYLSEKKKVVAKNSYNVYKQHINFFRTWIIDHNLSYLSIKDVERSNIMQFLSDYKEKSKCSNRHINNIKDNIISFFSYFVKNFKKTISENPASGMDDLPYTTQGNRPYTDKQIAKLKEVMAKENPNMLFFCEMVYESCTRPHEEARLLRVSDLQFDQNRIHIRPELSKEGRSEYIPMSAKFMERLKVYVEGAKETDFLFTINSNPGGRGHNPFRPGKKPVSMWTLQEWYRKIKTLCGMGGDESIYSWVHTYCCRAYLDTKDIFFIKEKKRHTDLAVTSNYLRGMGLFVDLQKVAENVREF